jgi:hypothetical protein
MTGKPVAPDNRRQAQRFDMALPLEFDHGRGKTRDISATGVFFTTAAATEAGEHLHCSVQFTEAQRLQFEALVVRVVKMGRRFGVAACFEALETALTDLEANAAKDGGSLQ